MELRHLRYFVAVAEAGSLTVAAQNLHTSQPSLSRQIRDLEDEIGVQLLGRSARRIELTAGGRAFLDHARAVLTQAEAGAEAARRVAHPAKPCFAMGFLTGHELTWMPEALQILRDELPNIDVMIILAATCGRPFERKNRCSFSPKGTRNARVGIPSSREGAFDGDLADRSPSCCAQSHQSGGSSGRDFRDRVGHGSCTASGHRQLSEAVRTQYHASSRADHLAMGMSLIASTHGVGLLPAYAQNFIPSLVTSRPLKGEVPTVELVLGYKKSNESPVLKLLLSRLDELVARVSKKARKRQK